jgi:glycosyltransferase involved in cell wall biosynthesis
MTNKVSIIVSSLADPQKLNRCMESLNAQTFQPFEVIVGVNGLNGRNTVSDVSKNSPVKFLQLDDSTARPSMARFVNAAIKQSSGDLVIVLPDSYLLAPTFLEVTCAKLEESNCTGVFTNIRVVGRTQTILQRYLDAVNLLALPSEPVALLFKRKMFEAVGDLLADFEPLEFTEFLVRALISGAVFRSVERPLCFYNYESMTTEEYFQAEQLACEKLLHKYQEYYLQNMAKISAAKDARLYQLTSAVLPRLELLDANFMELKSAHENLNAKYNELDEHHRQSLASIKVTFTHLVRAVSAKLLLKR